MKSFKCFYITVILLTNLKAFTQSFLHVNYSQNRGLPSNETYKVLKDSKGYIWVASDRGISKFNGKIFQNFTTANGLPENSTIGLYEDYTGKIWAWTLLGEFSYYSNGKFIQLTNINKEIKKILNGGVISCISMDKENVIHIGNYNTNYDLKIRVNLKTNKHILLKQKTKNSGFYIDEFKFDKKKEIVLKYNNRSGINFSFKINNLELPVYRNGKLERIHFFGEISYPNARCVLLRNGNIILAIQNALWLLKPNLEIKKLKKYNGVIINIQVDKFGDLWVSPYKEGIFRYKNAIVNHVHEKLFLPRLSVSSIDLDFENGHWFSTLEKGVFYLQNINIKLLNSNNGLKNQNINKLKIGANNTLLAGTSDGFLNVINNKFIQNFELPKINQNYPINDILVENSSVILCANGLFIFNLRTKNINIKSELATYSITKNTSKLLLGGYEKVIQIKKDKLTYDPCDFKVKSICWKDSSSLYIGGVKGLWIFKKHKLIKLGKQNNLLSNRINDLKYNKKLLFIATENKGLLIYNGNKITQVDQEKGLLSNLCKSLFVKNNHVFIATNKGVCEVVFNDINNLSKFEIRNYTIKNGLLSNEANDLLIYKNKLTVATTKGISFIHLKPFINTVYSPPIYITQLKINDKRIEIKDTLHLKYYENNLTFKFNGLVFNRFKDISYRYRLIGLSKNWRYTKYNSVDFTTLPFGHYKMEVQVQNNDSIWGGNTAIVQIYIDPPFWHTWWFRILTGFCIFLSVYLFVKYRINQVKKRAAKKTELYKQAVLMEKEKSQLYEKAVEMEMKFLGGQMNPHFTFNAMNSIQYYMLNNEPLKAQQYLSKYSKLIRLVLENNMHKFVKVQHEVDLMELYMEIESMRFTKKFEYEIKLDEELKNDDYKIPPMIMQPYIENAIWHGIAHKEDGIGKILISIQLRGENTFCIIQDNGIGRVKSKQFKRVEKEHNSVGLLITQQRLKQLHAESDIKTNTKISDILNESGEVIGTKVELILPIKKSL